MHDENSNLFNLDDDEKQSKAAPRTISGSREPDRNANACTKEPKTRGKTKEQQQARDENRIIEHEKPLSARHANINASVPLIYAV